jgi:hypothetical protein
MGSSEDQFITTIINSMQESKRAKPSADLWQKISTKAEFVSYISWRQWQLAAAVGALLLILNTWALMSYDGISEPVEMVSEYPSLISNFSLYNK